MYASLCINQLSTLWSINLNKKPQYKNYVNGCIFDPQCVVCYVRNGWFVFSCHVWQPAKWIRQIRLLRAYRYAGKWSVRVHCYVRMYFMYVWWTVEIIMCLRWKLGSYDISRNNNNFYLYGTIKSNQSNCSVALNEIKINVRSCKSKNKNIYNYKLDKKKKLQLLKMLIQN